MSLTCCTLLFIGKVIRFRKDKNDRVDAHSAVMLIPDVNLKFSTDLVITLFLKLEKLLLTNVC